MFENLKFWKYERTITRIAMKYIDLEEKNKELHDEIIILERLVEHKEDVIKKLKGEK